MARFITKDTFELMSAKINGLELKGRKRNGKIQYIKKKIKLHISSQFVIAIIVIVSYYGINIIL